MTRQLHALRSPIQMSDVKQRDKTPQNSVVVSPSPFLSDGRAVVAVTSRFDSW